MHYQMMYISKKAAVMQVPKLILFIMTIFSSCFSGLSDKPNCIKEDDVTVTCNYIPADIQPEISRVRIVMNFVTDLEPVVITQANFPPSSWSQITYLEISDTEENLNGNWSLKNGCFSSLTSLNELHIHILYLDIFEDTFIGLGEVTVLDFSNSVRLEKNMLLPALNGTNKLPKLRELLLSNWNSYHLPYDFDETFVQTLLPRRITHLDISSTHISVLNFSAIFKSLKYLERLNISYSNIEQEYHRHPDITHNDMKQVRVFDLSHAILPRQFMPLVPFDYLISNENITFSQIGLHLIPFLFAAESVNISGIFPYYINVFIEHVIFTIDEDMNWFVKSLIFRQNNVKTLDVQLICDNYTTSSIEHLDISDNGLQFMHPTLLYCMPNLYVINLAKNQLFKMVKEHRTVFEKLFLGLNRLKYIFLSANDLNDVPLYTFSNCRNVQVIDLSNNRLSQVTFLLDDLNRLEILDLQNNNIQILDQISLNRLNFLWRGNRPNEFKANLILRSNPLSCSKCATRSFIKWLTSKMLSVLMIQNITCFNENGNQELITENTLNIVQKICDRKTILISSTVSAVVFVSVVIVLGLFMYKRQKRLKKIQTRGETMALLRQGEGRYEFMTFLSYSSDDEVFVENYILGQLNEHLQRVTGIDRQLVCTGDRYFRPGIYVHNEMDRCLDTASVVIVVISNSFCASEYCCQELDQACVKRKPVLLMLIGEVEVKMMTQRMKELYYRNARLLWTLGENREYVMKTTWENVCESILDLMIN